LKNSEIGSVASCRKKTAGFSGLCLLPAFVRVICQLRRGTVIGGRVRTHEVIGLQSSHTRFFDKTVGYTVTPVTNTHQQVGKSHQADNALSLLSCNFSADLSSMLLECILQKIFL